MRSCSCMRAGCSGRNARGSMRDWAALREAGLEPPSVLRLWECLQDKGMISRAEQAPRSTDELIRMLERDDTDVQNKERI